RFCPYVSYTLSPSDSSALSLHDALPICLVRSTWADRRSEGPAVRNTATTASTRLARPTPTARPPVRRSALIASPRARAFPGAPRSEEHTSELQSRFELVCRLLLEKKKLYGNEALAGTIFLVSQPNPVNELFGEAAIGNYGTFEASVENIATCGGFTASIFAELFVT